jgi:hypothetical protein
MANTGEGNEMHRGEAEALAEIAHLETRSTLHAAAEHLPTTGRSESSTSAPLNRNGSQSAASVVVDDLRAAKSQIQALQRTVKQQKQDLERKDQQIAQITGRYDKEVMQGREHQAALKSAEAQLAILKKEIAMMQHNLAKGSSGPAKGEDSDAARVRKLEAELRAAREELGELRAAQNADAAAATVARLTEDNKQLAKQRTEFLACLRKQNKLIDVLKRQKIHLEAAKLLQLTEAEFTESLDRNR